MNHNVALYHALFAYPAGDSRHEATTDILFTATNHPRAIEDAVRFYRSRQKAIPDHFGKLWCIKVSLNYFAPIAEAGSLEPQHTPPFFEWKHDRGVPLELEIESYRRCSDPRRKA